MLCAIAAGMNWRMGDRIPRARARTRPQTPWPAGKHAIIMALPQHARLLLTGATGHTGSKLAWRLAGDGFRVRSWQARGQDGGNGGGGDASKPPIFVLGDASVGVWNFRSCPEGTEDVHFPAAARFELCLPFPDLETANDSLTATNKYLTRLFVYVMLVPFAIELRPQKLVISSLGAVM